MTNTNVASKKIKIHTWLSEISNSSICIDVKNQNSFPATLNVCEGGLARRLSSCIQLDINKSGSLNDQIYKKSIIINGDEYCTIRIPLSSIEPKNSNYLISLYFQFQSSQPGQQDEIIVCKNFKLQSKGCDILYHLSSKDISALCRSTYDSQSNTPSTELDESISVIEKRSIESTNCIKEKQREIDLIKTNIESIQKESAINSNLISNKRKEIHDTEDVIFRLREELTALNESHVQNLKEQGIAEKERDRIEKEINLIQTERDEYDATV